MNTRIVMFYRLYNIEISTTIIRELALNLCETSYLKIVLPITALEFFCNLARVDYKLPEDDTIVSIHVGV